jgi:hypothetical protein
MENVIEHAGGWLAPAAYVAILSVTVSGASLVLLHVLSPELAPSWRMVSEYANGQHRWLLTFVFSWWALSSFALLAALWPIAATTLGKVGLLFLMLAGIGQAMGALFDVNHPLHGLAAMIGIPSLCVAAVLLNLALARHPGIDAPPQWAAHLPWISFALMIGALMLLFSALKSAGVEVGPQAQPLKELPAGVSGYVGWANRLLFAASYLWVALAAVSVLRAKA